MSCNNFNQNESFHYYPNCYNDEYYEEGMPSQEVLKKCCSQEINDNCCKQSYNGNLNRPAQNWQQSGFESYERQCNNNQQISNKKCCKKHFCCFERNYELEVEKFACKENNKRNCCKKGIFSGFFKIC